MIDCTSIPDDIDALIFDCDGTLVDTPPLYARAWDIGFATSGRVAGPEWYGGRAGLSEHLLMDAFEAAFGVALDRPATVQRMRTAFLDNIAELEEIAAVCQIARANRGRRKMAVASGGSRQIVGATLHGAGLTPLFDAIVTLDDVGRAKPDPALFLEAARKLEVPPARCLVFEDSREGLEAAHRAGMRAVDVRAVTAPTMSG